jgi:hypothetical protein
MRIDKARVDGEVSPEEGISMNPTLAQAVKNASMTYLLKSVRGDQQAVALQDLIDIEKRSESYASKPGHLVVKYGDHVLAVRVPRVGWEEIGTDGDFLPFQVKRFLDLIKDRLTAIGVGVVG